MLWTSLRNKLANNLKGSNSHEVSSRSEIGLWQVIVDICFCVLILLKVFSNAEVSGFQ